MFIRLCLSSDRIYLPQLISACSNMSCQNTTCQTHPRPSAARCILINTRSALLVVVSILVILISSPVCSALNTEELLAKTSDLSSMFSLDRLGEYNQLIDCITKIRQSFTRCNVDAQRKGETVLKYVDEKSEMGTLLKCCGVWLVRDCWVNAARQNCTDDQVEQLRNMPSKFMPGLENVCEKYPPGSASCYTPHVIVAAVLFSGLVLFILIVVVIIVVTRSYLRRNQTKRSKSIGSGDEEDGSPLAEKAKLTSESNNNNNNNNENIHFIDSDK